VLLFVVLAPIAGAVIASIFYLIRMEEREAGKRGFILSTATDDPFTGMWREKGGLSGNRRLAIKPSGDGLSFQESMSGEPLVISYGVEFGDERRFIEAMDPVMITVVRVDGHTLEFSYRSCNTLFLKDTYTVSSDGKHLIENWEYTGGRNKLAIYNRIRRVRKGDAFFGTWQLRTYATTIKADRETIDWYVGDIHIVKAKFDRKDYKGDNPGNKKATYRFHRLDEHTIEMAMKSELSVLKEVWQVHNNTLKRTAIYIFRCDRYLEGPRTSVTEYQRIK
jgi:hypothetical protein